MTNTFAKTLNQKAERFEKAAAAIRQVVTIISDISVNRIDDEEISRGVFSKAKSVEGLKSFLAQGPKRMNDIIGELNVSRGTLYRWYRLNRDTVKKSKGIWQLKYKK